MSCWSKAHLFKETLFISELVHVNVVVDKAHLFEQHYLFQYKIYDLDKIYKLN